MPWFLRCLVATVLFAVGLAGAACADTTGPILRVIDGDTYEISAPWLPPELGTTISIRVLGIDTPEHGFRAKCRSEAQKSDQGIAFVTGQFLAARQITVKMKHWDKFGGRVDGDVLVDGVSIGALLIAQGFARPYDGGAKQSWCH